MAPRGSTPVEITAVTLRFSNTMGWPSGEFTVAPQDGGSGWCLEGGTRHVHLHGIWSGGWGEGGGDAVGKPVGIVPIRLRKRGSQNSYRPHSAK